jgi:hypothetical protein
MFHAKSNEQRTLTLKRRQRRDPFLIPSSGDDLVNKHVVLGIDLLVCA